jgi:two-component system phosphate regulon response regulator PhoB
MRQNIFFVDDDRRRTDIYVEMLRMEGYDVTFAATIKEAEKELKDGNFDFHLVILDIMMPYGGYIGENSLESRTRGIEFLKDIRKIKKEDELPVIILTVCSDEIIKKETYEAGCNEYLEKPCYPSVLLEKVEEYLKVES